MNSRTLKLNSPLKKPPGEGTGPKTHADFRGNLVGRVPSRGEQDVFERAVNPGTAASRSYSNRRASWPPSLGR